MHPIRIDDQAMLRCQPLAPASGPRYFLRDPRGSADDEQLVKTHGPKDVLQNVSLSIPAGQTLALLGRNGAAKTTMIRILVGLLPADSGVCRLGGVDPAVDPLEVRRNVGYLAEDQTMYGWMTPVELCRFLAPFYPTWDMKLARDSLDRFGIPSHTRVGRHKSSVPWPESGHEQSVVEAVA
jgi:ABC-type multidrug transport system ATPase subunit